MRKIFAYVFITATVVLIVLALTQSPLPKGPGVELVMTKCQTCHGLEYVTDSAGISREMWAETISEMEEYGMEIEPEERETLLNYLATYLGPHPPSEADSSPRSSESRDGTIDAAELYRQSCAACHRAQGEGMGRLAPPLAGNEILFKDRRYALLVVLHGLEGEIKVGDRSFDGQMPPTAHLRDEQVAAIINYILTAWGNDKHRPADFVSLSPEDAAKARSESLTPRQVWEYRRKLQ